MSQKIKYKIDNIPTGQISGIYALIDNEGKCYIGSSKNIQQRVKQHRSTMSMTLNLGHSVSINPLMEQAVKDGKTFRCEVLAQFNCEMTREELREIERIFIKKAGGIGNTYNQSVISHKI